MRLMILRHAEAELIAASDAARTLTVYGQHQAEQVGEYLQKHAYCFDILASSPFERTVQTAGIVSQYCDIQQQQQWPELSYHSDAVQAELRLMSAQTTNLLLVSHMPLVASLEAYLVGGQATVGLAFQTAELAVLNSNDAFPGGWQLEQRVRFT